VTELDAAFATDGPLAERLPGYAPRQQQQRMARAVAEAIAGRNLLVCEAGTGTGKTLAYLIPALQSGRKVLVSTGTKTLQDQLFHKDLPLALEVTGSRASIALLKGRGNYLCPHRLAVNQNGELGAREREHMARILRWSRRTDSGDLSEAGEIPEDAPIFQLVTSNRDNCLGQECARIAECHLLHARRRAQEADLVVVNHHLLLADMALRDEGVSELLPDADAIVVDEAHQLPETAAQFFSLSLGGRQVAELARDTVAEHLAAAGKVATRPAAAEAVEHALRGLRLALGESTQRGPWEEAARDAEVKRFLTSLGEALDDLEAWLDTESHRSRGLDNCRQRCAQFRHRLSLLLGGVDDTHVAWYETHKRSFTLTLTPLDIADDFERSRQSYRAAWIFTSATLAVEGAFGHFRAQLGLENPDTLCLDSPFDYRRHAVLYHPEGLPEPNSEDYNAAVVEAAVPVLEASQGRAFLLFTSYRALDAAAERLSQRIRYPLLVQGSMPRHELLERFRETANAVLLGTASFWEGVDVRGDALSCVIIDRLPFSSPGDPVLAARIEALRERGLNAFRSHQLPEAVIGLKQGVGRLIRDVNDRGVLMLCDPRLLRRDYGRVFLDSLPPMTRTRRLEVVRRFFQLHCDAAQEAGA
jgi:ATP-dependent DNA helicase DinG